jgi:hemerythrin-like metal-binding protein
MAQTPSPSGTSSWSDRYALGVEVIDQQHQRLFRLIDQLAWGIQQGNAEPALQSVFDELSDYTKTHFQTEEQLMAESGFPGGAGHREKHRGLEASLADLVAKASRGEPWVSLETMNFLRQWLYHHIDDTDRQLAVHLNSRTS